MSDILTFLDAETSIRALEDQVRNLQTLNQDFKGRRIQNAGPSQAPLDYVVRQEVDPLALRILDIETILGLADAPGGSNVSGLSISGLTNPLIESILVSMDSTYDIGESGANPRIRWGFADVWNAELLEVTNAAHLLNWQFQQDAATTAELDLKDTAANIVVTFKESAVEFLQDILVGNDGSANVRQLSMRGDVRGIQPIVQMEWATDNVAFQSPGPLAIIASYHVTPADLGAVEVQTTSGGDCVFRPSSAGDVAVTNHFLGDLNVPWQEVYAMQITARFITGGVPLVRWDDVGGNNNWAYIYGPPISGSSWAIQLPNSGPSGGDVLADSGSGGAASSDLMQWVSVTAPAYSIAPGSHNTYNHGSSTSVWAEMYAQGLTLGKAAATRLQGVLTIANVTDSNLFLISGISKDGIGTGEVTGSLAMDSSANFYNRIYSGADVNCTGIDDGWTGIRTDTSELQVCIGGSMVAVTLA